MFLGGTYRRLETEVHKAKYGNRLSRSTPHHFSSVFAYGASRSHRGTDLTLRIFEGTVSMDGARWRNRRRSPAEYLFRGPPKLSTALLTHIWIFKATMVHNSHIHQWRCFVMGVE
ncbi:hypothetical protein J6590_057796 [Homalodisca vitripennis]|nr:hypothetical protein J6590_057796 [Homalodisca vitripennis]